MRSTLSTSIIRKPESAYSLSSALISDDFPVPRDPHKSTLLAGSRLTNCSRIAVYGLLLSVDLPQIPKAYLMWVGDLAQITHSRSPAATGTRPSATSRRRSGAAGPRPRREQRVGPNGQAHLRLWAQPYAHYTQGGLEPGVVAR